jgi:hypothetical protein
VVVVVVVVVVVPCCLKLPPSLFHLRASSRVDKRMEVDLLFSRITHSLTHSLNTLHPSFSRFPWWRRGADKQAGRSLWKNTNFLSFLFFFSFRCFLFSPLSFSYPLLSPASKPVVDNVNYCSSRRPPTKLTSDIGGLHSPRGVLDGIFPYSECLAVPAVGVVRADPYEAIVDSAASASTSTSTSRAIVTTALIDTCDVYHPIRIFARR